MNGRRGPSSPQRLARLDVGTLRVKLGLARTAWTHAQTAFQREQAKREIADIEAELAKRPKAEA